MAKKIYFRPGIEAFAWISVETLSQILIFCRKHRLDRPHNTQKLWMVFTQWALSILSTNPSMIASITYKSNLARSIKLKLNSDGPAEPVPRVAIFFTARPKMWACARPPTLTDWKERCSDRYWIVAARHRSHGQWPPCHASAAAVRSLIVRTEQNQFRPFKTLKEANFMFGNKLANSVIYWHFR